MMGNEQEVRSDRSLLNLPQVTQHLGKVASSQVNRHLRISSPQGKKGMAAPQASPNPLWPLISLPSSLACQTHRLHLKLASDFRRPGMPLHFLWTQLEQPPQKMKFVPTPFRHMPQGSLPDCWRISSSGPDIRTLVLHMRTQGPFPSILVFQRISFCNSFSDSVITRSSRYRFS